MLRGRLQVLTPVHVGSGSTLNVNVDYYTTDRLVVIIDDKKIARLIGEDKIDQWVSAIQNRENFKEFINRMTAGNICEMPERIAHRICRLESSNTRCSRLKEHYHSSMMGVTIPGSSLKGSFTTLLLNAFMDDKFFQNVTFNELLDNPGANDASGMIHGSSYRRRISDKKIMNRFFGDTPNNSINRFLKIYDVNFFSCNTHVYEINIIRFNEDTRNWGLMGGHSVLVECIPPDASSEFVFKLDGKYYNYNKKINANIWQGKQDAHLKDVKEFFNIIREMQKNIIEEECNLFENSNLEDSKIASNCFLQLINVLKKLESCEPNECILRIGGHVGWKFTTGGWIKKCDRKQITDENMAEIRRAIQRKSYPRESVWPKTRKLTANGLPLGFVKIALDMN